MPKFELKFLETHNPVFIGGANLGKRLDIKTKKVKLLLDTDVGVVWIFYNSGIDFVPFASIASGSALNTEDFGLGEFKEPEPYTTPAIQRARQSAVYIAETTPAPEPVPMPTFDPNDLEAAAEHRRKVRAASANANRPEVLSPQNDDLIQKARMTAAGIKHTAQVQTAQQVGELAKVTGKRKAISHAELNADKNK